MNATQTTQPTTTETTMTTTTQTKTPRSITTKSGYVVTDPHSPLLTAAEHGTLMAVGIDMRWNSS